MIAFLKACARVLLPRVRARLLVTLFPRNRCQKVLCHCVSQRRCQADVYGVCNDGHYKTSLRGTIVFKDLLTQCSHLADSLDEITAVANKGVSAPAADVQEVPGTVAAPVPDMDFLDPKIVAVDDSNELARWQDSATLVFSLHGGSGASMSLSVYILSG